MHIACVDNWDFNVDIVIVGSGATGITAATEAASTGAEILLVEKEKNPFKSSTVHSGGAISFAGTDMQAELGIEDSKDLFFRDIMTAGGWKNDVELVQSFIDDQLDTYYFLRRCGVEFYKVEIRAGMSVPRAHITRIGRTISVLKDTAKQKGVRLLFGTRGRRLVEDDVGRVVGLEIDGNYGHKFISVRKGIVLASGGFGNCEKMISEVGMDLTKVKNLVSRNCTGDGHKMALELGAGFRDLAYVRPTYGIHVNGNSTRDTLMVYYLGAIIINKLGKRFVDESLPYKEVGVHVLAQPDAVGIMIFDEKIREKAEGQVFGVTPRVKHLCKKATSLRELAHLLEIPSQTLEETVERYNKYVGEGIDPEFGKKGLAGPYGTLVKLNSPPFYAFEAVGALVGTYAGLTVDSKMRVKNIFDEIIPGLHAAGEIIGGFHGAGYVAGTALGKAFVFGRTAGREASR